MAVGPGKELLPFAELVLTCVEKAWSLASTGDRMEPNAIYESLRFTVDAESLEHLIDYLQTIAQALAAMQAAMPESKTKTTEGVN